MNNHTGMGANTAVHFEDVANRMNRFLQNNNGGQGKLRRANGDVNNPARSNRVAARSRNGGGGGHPGGAGDFARRFIRNLFH